MRTIDLKKVTRAGFIVIRPADVPAFRIESYTVVNGWITMCEYRTKDERDHALEILLENKHMILD